MAKRKSIKGNRVGVDGVLSVEQAQAVKRRIDAAVRLIPDNLDRINSNRLLVVQDILILVVRSARPLLGEGEEGFEDAQALCVHQENLERYLS